MSATAKPTTKSGIQKCPTGITGLDQVTEGGLPKGRPTLLCGSAGCGKTVLAMEFLVRGITECNEPGVFMAFEETDKELTENVASGGSDSRNTGDGIQGERDRTQSQGNGALPQGRSGRRAW